MNETIAKICRQEVSCSFSRHFQQKRDTVLCSEMPEENSQGTNALTAVKFVQKRGPVKAETGVYPESFKGPQYLAEPRPLLDAQRQKIAARDGKDRRVVAFGSIQKTRETTGADHGIVAACGIGPRRGIGETNAVEY